MSEFSLERDLVRRAPVTAGGEGDFRRRTPDRGAATRTQAQIDRSMHRMFGGVTPEHALAHEQVAAENREVQGKGFFGRMGTRLKQGLLGLGFGKLFGRKRGEDEEPAERSTRPKGQKMGWMQRLFGARRTGRDLPFGTATAKKPGWADALVDADLSGALEGRKEGSNWFDDQPVDAGGKKLSSGSSSKETYLPSPKPLDDHGEDFAHLNQVPQFDLFRQGEFGGGGNRTAHHPSDALSDSSDEDEGDADYDPRGKQYMFNQFLETMAKNRMKA